jgi:hypothetical protein
MKMRICAIVFLSLVLLFVGIACYDGSGDDDDETGDDDDDDSFECHFTINPEGDATAKRLTVTAENIDDCLPPDLDEVFRDQLTILLGVYLGQYRSELDTERTISCRPEGTWELPNYDPDYAAFCGWHYLMPVWIEMEENEGAFPGRIRQYVVPSLENDEITDGDCYMRFFLSEEEGFGAVSEVDGGVVWEFLPQFPSEELIPGFVTWTKDEHL